MTLSICVFCALALGAAQTTPTQRARRVPKSRRRGWTLVYGGGRVGLMGVLADAAPRRPARRVIGVIPRFLFEREVAPSRA